MYNERTHPDYSLVIAQMAIDIEKISNTYIELKDKDVSKLEELFGQKAMFWTVKGDCFCCS